MYRSCVGIILYYCFLIVVGKYLGIILYKISLFVNGILMWRKCYDCIFVIGFIFLLYGCSVCDLIKELGG